MYSYAEGFVTEISLMLNSQATNEAVQMIRDRNIQSVGIHLNLNNLKGGHHISYNEYKKILAETDEEQLIDTISNELSEFENKLNRVPSHIAPHQGLHGDLRILNYLITYAKEKNIPIRIPRTALAGDIKGENYTAEILLKRNKILQTDYIFNEITGSDIKKVKGNILQNLRGVDSRKSAELFLHPGFVDKELIELSSLTYERARDIAILTDRDFFLQIKKIGFKLVNYSRI